MLYVRAVLAFILLVCCVTPLHAGFPARALGSVRGQPFERFETTDEFDRRVLFYLSEPVVDVELPLVVWIQGSGYGSVFQSFGDRVRGVTGHSSVQRASEGLARVLLVEKVGTPYLAKPTPRGGAIDAPEVFRREHTLPRWSAAVEAAIRASWTLPGVDDSRTMVIGHSEGGVAASRVAARMEEVSHVGVLAGEGPTQLYSLIRLARSGSFDLSGSPDEREQWVLDGWRRVLADPHSADEMFFGHPHRRWSTFCVAGPVHELRGSNAAVFIAQGLEDLAVEPTSAEVLYAELLSTGRRVELFRVERADHSFNVWQGEELVSSELERVAERALSFFLEAPFP